MKWHHILIAAALLAALVLTAACTDEAPQGPPPEERSPALPGQPLVAIGQVTGDGIARGTIDTITFKIGLVPGEKAVPMENVSIVYADAIRTETLVPVVGLRGNPPQGSWGILEVKNEVGKPNNRLEYEEEFVIRINPKAPLVPRQFIMISVQPPAGTALNLRRVSPASIVAENNVLGIV